MKCSNCNREVQNHSDEEINECLGALGIDRGDKSPIQLAAELGLSIGVNYRHSTIVFNGLPIKTKDINREILCLCLANSEAASPVAPPVEEKKRDEEEENPKTEEVEKWPGFTLFDEDKNEDEDDPNDDSEVQG